MQATTGGTQNSSADNGTATPHPSLTELSALTLDNSTPAPSRARGWTREQLASWRPGVPTENATLLVSELVTNAVRYAPGDSIDLELELRGTELTITVSDAGTPKAPLAAKRPGNDAESGRGLTLVEALSLRWGTRQTPAGKAVWATLALTENPT
jgi:anti-sigma regulatory factor (Ser/Thr protein kinase)